MKQSFDDIPYNFEERLKYFKILLSRSMSLEDRLDELWDVPDKELQTLFEKFQQDEEYEICHTPFLSVRFKLYCSIGLYFYL